MSVIETERLRLTLLSPDAIDELLADPPEWADANLLRFLRLKVGQLRRDPAEERWGPRLVTLRAAETQTVGHVGFHGAPGMNGIDHPDAVEVGYTILEPYRRQGYASEAVSALIAWARRQGVDTVLASISPTNDASLTLARRLGFVEIGSRIDDEDGQELVFELVSDAT